MLLWSLYTIGLRWRPAGLSMLSFLFVIAVIGDLAMLPLYLVESALGRSMVWTWGAFGAFVAVGLFSSVLAYIFWNRGVEQVGANVAGLFVHLMPVFGALLAWVFLDERLQPSHVLGIALILTGIYLTSRKARVAVVAGTD
jgi:drug/metabolite transporter (DMT)-like permease